LVRTIPLRSLRNRISEVLRQVEAGERLRITVDGRPVADLVPLAGIRRTYVPREALQDLLTGELLDAEFVRDVDAAISTGTPGEGTGS
jgi:prevent-host-death family protein